MKAKPGAFPGGHGCAAPGCPAPGEYRAPLARPGSALAPPAGPGEWQYFCLDHVREFNARWNYFDGMSDEAIWAAQSPYAGWDDRATYPFAHNAAAMPELDDPLGILRWKQPRRQQRALSAEDRRALATLGLAEEASLDEVKAKYRQLARRYHPDTNQGDRRHEERFRQLTDAYRHLQESSAFAGR